MSWRLADILIRYSLLLPFRRFVDNRECDRIRKIGFFVNLFPMKTTIALLGLILIPATAISAGNFTWTTNCQKPERIKKHQGMSAALRAISAASGESVVLFSCYRSKSYNAKKRAESLKRNGGRSGVAKDSAHTSNIAADFNLFKSPGSKGCHLLNRKRLENLGNRGGIGAYNSTWFHLDAAGQRDWGRCDGITAGKSGARSIGKITDSNLTTSPKTKKYLTERPQKKLARKASAGRGQYCNLFGCFNYSDHKNRKKPSRKENR
jgi:hypothetical protein